MLLSSKHEDRPGPPPAPATVRAEQDAGLVGLGPVLEIVKTILWTGQVEGERPASAIICAPVGTGKTSVMEKIRTPVAEFCSDFTARDATRLIKNERLTHIMIGDLLSVLGHKTGTVKLSMNILAKLTGEALLSNPWTGDPIQPRQIGVITGIPPDELFSRKLRNVLWEGGFASRFMIIRYTYRVTTVRRIHDYIASDAYTTRKPFEFTVDTGRVAVEVPAPISAKIRDLAAHVKQDEIGARAHHHLRALVKARARMRKADIANDQDFAIVEQISDFFTGKGRNI